MVYEKKKLMGFTQLNKYLTLDSINYKTTSVWTNKFYQVQLKTPAAFCPRMQKPVIEVLHKTNGDT